MTKTTEPKDKFARIIENLKECNMKIMNEKKEEFKYLFFVQTIKIHMDKNINKLHSNNSFRNLVGYFEENHELWKEVERRLIHIESIEGCKLLKQISDEVERIYENAIERIEDKIKKQLKGDEINWIEMSLIERVGYLDHSICWCSECRRFNYYRDSLFNYLEDQSTINEVLVAYLDLKISGNNIKIVDMMETINPKHEIKGKYESDGKELVYFDQNVMDKYAKCPEFEMLVEASKNDFEYYYSPSHLDEINKWSNIEGKSILIGKMRKLTNDLVVLPWSHDGKKACLDLFYEEPACGLRRVKQEASNAVSILEETRLLKNKRIIVKYKEYIKPSHTKKISSIDILKEKGDLVNDCLKELEAPFSLNQVANIEYIYQDHVYINDVIYKLYSCLDIIGYNRDNEEPKIRSSVHDIEHLIYAVRGKVFVTGDNKFYHRSKVIFNHIQPEIKVSNYNDFYKYLSDRYSK